MRWFRHRSAVADECTAFLHGRYVEFIGSPDEVIPVWAWVNLLAHGTEEQLRADARDPAGDDAWHRARSFMSAEVLDVIDAGLIPLTTLQRVVLVPLEREVMACRAAAAWTPAELTLGLLRLLPDRSGRVG